MDFYFLDCLSTLNILTGSTRTFAHETKIIAKSAIKANNYSPTVTFIVLQQGMRHTGSKISRGAHAIPQGTVRCNLSRNYHKLHINNKTMLEKLCCGDAHL